MLIFKRENNYLWSVVDSPRLAMASGDSSALATQAQGSPLPSQQAVSSHDMLNLMYSFPCILW